MELSHSQVDTQGSLKLRREMEAVSRQVLAEAMGTGAFPGKDREHKEECVAQDRTPTKGEDEGKCQKTKLKKGTTRDYHRSQEQGVTKRSELYASSRQPT